MNSKNTLRIVFTGLFAALVCVAILIFHVPVGNGIVHLGDAFIYLGAIILPFPFGIFAGAIGGSLSDLLDGYAIYAFPTLIVAELALLLYSTEIAQQNYFAENYNCSISFLIDNDCWILFCCGNH